MEIRVADADRALIAQAATGRGLTTSEYVRLVVLAQARRDIAKS